MAINQAELFNNVPDEKIYMNDYDLSFDNILTTEMGRLTPIFCRRVLPGEKWSMSLDMFVRTMPLLSPVFGKMDIYAHAFYCTNRSLSDIWENYIRNGEDGEHYDPNDPESEPYQPDLLKVSYGGNLLEPRDNVLIDDVQNFQFINLLSGNAVVEDYRNYLSTAVMRPPLCHGSLFDYLNVTSFYSVTDIDFDNMQFPSSKILLPFKHSLLPFKAYQAIWSEYYADANIMTFENTDTIDFRWMTPINTIDVRSEDLSIEITSLTREGLDYPMQYSDSTVMRNLFNIRHRCYAKDYFTSSLPEPQRGPDVLIPIDANIDIKTDFKSSVPVDLLATSEDDENVPSEHVLYNYRDEFNPFGTIAVGSFASTASNPYAYAYGTITEQNFDYVTRNLRAEISSLSATITDLRTAVALQEFYESSSRYGNRYKEFVYGHFGSMIPDDQLTRPWYLGGIKIPVQISEVMQTSPEKDSPNGVGNMFGKGISATNENSFMFERQFDDYGLVMVILSIRPHNYYKNTVMKEWTIDDRLDEFWRKLQSVGEESIQNFELHGYSLSSGSGTANEHMYDTFGYQMRYSNYKFSNDEVHGDFKGDLSYWTMCRDFSNGVTLSPEFLTINPAEFNHIFQYSGNDVDHFLITSKINVIREAPMDIYSIPRIN